MALCDYMLCDVCGGKAFYDADINWDMARCKSLAVLCRECAKTHTIVIRDKRTGACTEPSNKEHYQMGAYWDAQEEPEL